MDIFIFWLIAIPILILLLAAALTSLDDELHLIDNNKDNIIIPNRYYKCLIPWHELNKHFKPFTGLGFYIIKIDEHNGIITGVYAGKFSITQEYNYTEKEFINLFELKPKIYFNNKLINTN